MELSSLRVIACDKYKIWEAEHVVDGIRMLCRHLSSEDLELILNQDPERKELAQNVEKTAQFIHKTLSDCLDNVAVVAEVAKNSSFWSVYIDGRTICENVSTIGILNRVFNITVSESSKEKKLW